MKTNIKMRVTPEQSRKVQEICFKNDIGWDTCKKDTIRNDTSKFLYIEDVITHAFSKSPYSDDDFKKENDFFHEQELEEIDADLFIRTNGTCEEKISKKIMKENTENLETFIKKNNYENISDLKRIIVLTANKHDILEIKLKKKNEILKKARIKRKNQREELHKLNLKLQKCISLEEHHLKIKTVLNEKHYLEKENKSLKESSKISCNMLHSQKDKIDRLELNYVTEQSRYKKEIEKLKAVIEYLESKVK